MHIELLHPEQHKSKNYQYDTFSCKRYNILFASKSLLALIPAMEIQNKIVFPRISWVITIKTHGICSIFINGFLELGEVESRIANRILVQLILETK